MWSEPAAKRRRTTVASAPSRAAMPLVAARARALFSAVPFFMKNATGSLAQKQENLQQQQQQLLQTQLEQQQYEQSQQQQESIQPIETPASPGSLAKHSAPEGLLRRATSSRFVRPEPFFNTRRAGMSSMSPKERMKELLRRQRLLRLLRRDRVILGRVKTVDKLRKDVHIVIRCVFKNEHDSINEDVLCGRRFLRRFVDAGRDRQQQEEISDSDDSDSDGDTEVDDDGKEEKVGDVGRLGVVAICPGAHCPTAVREGAYIKARVLSTDPLTEKVFVSMNQSSRVRSVHSLGAQFLVPRERAQSAHTSAWNATSPEVAASLPSPRSALRYIEPTTQSGSTIESSGDAHNAAQGGGTVSTHTHDESDPSFLPTSFRAPVLTFGVRNKNAFRAASLQPVAAGRANPYGWSQVVANSNEINDESEKEKAGLHAGADGAFLRRTVNEHMHRNPNGVYLWTEVFAAREHASVLGDSATGRKDRPQDGSQDRPQGTWQTLRQRQMRHWADVECARAAVLLCAAGVLSHEADDALGPLPPINESTEANEAISVLKHACNIDADLPRTRLLLARALASVGSVQEALDALNSLPVCKETDFALEPRELQRVAQLRDDLTRLSARIPQQQPHEHQVDRDALGDL